MRGLTGMGSCGKVCGMRGLAGMGCSSCGKACGMQGLPDSYSSMSWNDPSQSSPGGSFGMNNPATGQGLAVGVPGTAASALVQTSPDYPSPTSLAVVHSFSNEWAGAQPGVLPLNPNWTANNLSFVKPLPQSPGCTFSQMIEGNPVVFIGGVFLLFMLVGRGMKG